MPISPAASILNTLAGLPAQAPAATGPTTPASPAARAAEAALAAKQARQQVQDPAANLPSMTAESHRAVANLPRGSFLNILV
jgi:hypothetical protein